MKRWGLLFLLSLSLLLIAGCSENEPLHNNNSNNNSDNNNKTFPLQNQLKNSRFVSKSESDQEEITDQKTGSEDDFQYYRPTEQINKKVLIPADIDNDINRNTIEIIMWSVRDTGSYLKYLRMY